jgi:UDPglucose--hexose-1-phosphate uridylyltransferase
VLEPFAPRFPFETWILPRGHADSFHTMSDAAEFRDLAAVLKETLQRLYRALDRPPFNFAIHTAPVSDTELEHYHWHLEIMPKLTRVAGFEIGSGFYINPTPPEDAAQYLREIAVEA